eukprot:366472-Chlamydomonas_euryale.AAC.6
MSMHKLDGPKHAGVLRRLLRKPARDNSIFAMRAQASHPRGLSPQSASCKRVRPGLSCGRIVRRSGPRLGDIGTAALDLFGQAKARARLPDGAYRSAAHPRTGASHAR